VRGYEAGADDYLVKPVRSPEFHAKVSLLLRQRRARAKAPARAPGAASGGARLIDRYAILDLLGEGAYGVVHRAKRLGCDDIVALKVLSQAKLSKRSIARFLRETEVLKTLGDIEGISKVVDVGFDGESYFYAMELIEGASLRQILDGKGPVDEQTALSVAKDVTTVLAALDGAEIVHRDIKPGNIILGTEGRATLIDFGLAREVESARVTGKHELPGTPAYIPPEAIRGEPFDIRGDIYSLGVTLFEMLTGRLPYEADSGLFLLVHVADGTPANLDPLLDLDISPGFCGVIERMIANTPEDRYESPAELLEDLADAV